jgi:membrane-bound lytic murein transglycosylase
MQGVMQSLAQSNPDMMKTREGRITLGMAALKFAPLMHQQDQMEMQRMKMELANQIQMLKLSQGEANLGIQQQRAEAYEAKMKSGADPSKSLENAIKERDTVANHLAQQPNSKELRRSYNEVQKRVDELNKKVNPQGAAKEYSSWLEEAAGSSNPVEKALTSVPQDVISKLRPEEQRQLGEMLITEPIKAHMRIMRLREKMRGGETTVGKSDGNY